MSNVISLNKDGATPVDDATLNAGSVVTAFVTDNKLDVSTLVFGGVDADGDARVGFLFSEDETKEAKIVRVLRVKLALEQVISSLL